MWIGARRYAPDWVAFALMLWFAFGTLLRPAAYNFAPDVLSTLLVVGGVVALLYGRCVAAGVLLGLSLWAKWTNAVFFPVAVAALAARRDWRALLRFGAAAAAAGRRAAGAQLAHVRLAVRHALRSRADRRATMRWVVEPSHRTFFTVPFWRGLWTQLTDARRWACCRAAPPVLLALPGFVAAVSPRPLARRCWSAARASPSSRCSRSTSSGTCPATGRASCCRSWR